jgi:hypothetical protein
MAEDKKNERKLRKVLKAKAVETKTSPDALKKIQAKIKRKKSQ